MPRQSKRNPHEKQVLPGFRLGWKPSPPALKARALRLEKYVQLLPSPPQEIDCTFGITNWPMYANDQKGDCTCAAAGHMLEIWSKQVDGSERILRDDQVLALYDLVNGGVDAGADEMTVLETWRQQGLAGDTIKAFCAVNPADLKLVQTATWLFSGLYLGVALPLSAQQQLQDGKPWDVIDGAGSQPGSWGGHAVNVVRLDADGLDVITWGRTYRMTWSFWQKYVIEAWAVIPSDYDRLGSNPLQNGFREADLEADLAAIAS